MNAQYVLTNDVPSQRAHEKNNLITNGWPGIDFGIIAKKCQKGIEEGIVIVGHGLIEKISVVEEIQLQIIVIRVVYIFYGLGGPLQGITRCQ